MFLSLYSDKFSSARLSQTVLDSFHNVFKSWRIAAELAFRIQYNWYKLMHKFSHAWRLTHDLRSVACSQQMLPELKWTSGMCWNSCTEIYVVISCKTSRLPAKMNGALIGESRPECALGQVTEDYRRHQNQSSNSHLEIFGTTSSLSRHLNTTRQFRLQNDSQKGSEIADSLYQDIWSCNRRKADAWACNSLHMIRDEI